MNIMEKYYLFFVLVSIVSLAVCYPNRNQKERISQIRCQEYTDLVRNIPKPGTPKYSCKYLFGGLIVGGVDASPGEFPHMTAIGWKISSSQDGFYCGGSLISKKFVLTVAHCEKHKDIAPSFVRLGDQNLLTLDDGAQPKDYNIKKFIKHPQYSGYKKSNDIALIELKETVTFTEFIRPACLNQVDSELSRIIATGWGQNSTFGDVTDELQKVQLDVMSDAKCKEYYDEEDKIVYASQICGKGEGRKDTCRGDSGGPIQVSLDGIPCVYNIVGLTSFGNFHCGSAPAIYTRVTSYLDWIENKVWP